MTIAEFEDQLKVHARQQKELAKKAEADGDKATAELHWARSLTAKSGKLLNREEEYRDPTYMMEHQSIRNLAIKFGRITTDPVVKV